MLAAWVTTSLIATDGADAVAAPIAPPPVKITPSKPTATYEVGEKVMWTLSPVDTSAAKTYAYVVKQNNFTPIKSGEIDLSTNATATIEASCNEPAMLFLELIATDANPKCAPVAVAGAAIAPTKLTPAAARPDDFDAFWESKLKWLRTIAPNPKLTPKDAGDDRVDYATIQMDHVSGTHVYGQIAKPKNSSKKLPALVIFQWASPPYPLEKVWVTQPAADGWLTLNIEPHDVLPDQPPAYYAALPDTLKNYHSIGNDDRDENYFVEMFLRDVRAVDYITTHPDWDGKTLVVMGTSMGGMQALAAAGLHPKVTHVIVNEPAGCDTNASLHGRQAGYPNFPVEKNPEVAETARYVDVVNFAPRITAKALVAMGFVDTVCPPTGIWTAFNQIKGQKEAAPMIDSAHNHQATPEQQKPYTDRSAQWLRTIATGGQLFYDDHQNMMDQLGIRQLRPGPDPNDPKTYDESLANQNISSLPDALRMKDGTRIASPSQWPARRAEIVEEFEREVFGRIPNDVPKVEWRIARSSRGQSGNVPTITTELVGHVDNSKHPQISVEIEASFTVPENTAGTVPMMLTFAPSRRPGGATRPSIVPSWTDQAIAHGWGYGRINPASIQPDNNQLTTTGIIGLTNRGQPRTPEQWGALRAWQWGVSRLIDYFEAHPEAKVDPTKIGIEGVSRYGKAALVTQAFDPRVAVSLVASSGEGGAKLHRHLIGERIENLAGGEYYWMAGNIIKYGASDPEKTVADLPVDAHELIALCAPRRCFISYGTVNGGDPLWVDARGSWMAGVLASEVYELLGKHGFGGKPDDFLTRPMPSVNELVGGELAWRQHDGGHDVTPNWPAFFEWVSAYIPATERK
jgi:cephalosporin-C deacetylase-like acetyl esterase